MGTTSIEWTDRTWNPTRGCQLVSPGCSNCYAMKFAHRFSAPGNSYAGLTKLRGKGPLWTGEVRTATEMLDQPLRWKKPQKVFVNSMSDLFHEDVPNEYIAAVFGVMAAVPRHTFQILTKRAKRLPEWFAWAEKRGHDGARLFADDPLDWRIRQMCHVEARRHRVDLDADARQNHGGPWPLPNVWIGVSVEDQRRADERIPELLRIPAAVRFLSCEPLLGPVDLRAVPLPDGDELGEALDSQGARAGLDWVIVGGESGHDARPMNLQWARSLVAQCKAADTPCFVKQLGASVHWDGCAPPGGAWPAGTRPSDTGRGYWLVQLKSRKGGDTAEWPHDLRVREFPEVTP